MEPKRPVIIVSCILHFHAFCRLKRSKSKLFSLEENNPIVAAYTYSRPLGLKILKPSFTFHFCSIRCAYLIIVLHN